MGFLSAALSGMLMAVQGAMIATLSRRLGLYWMLVSLQLIALVGALALTLWRTPHLPRFGAPALHLYLAAPIGIGITLLVALAVPRLGMVRATTALVIAQLVTAAALDQFGLLGMIGRPFALWRLAGVALLAAGAWVLLR
jgi:transporter family-2 protein